MTAKKIIEELSKVNKDFTVDVNSMWTDLLLEIDSVEINSFGIVFKLASNGKIRTVKQIIEKLSKYDQDLNVSVGCDCNKKYFYGVINIETFKKSVVLETY